MCAASRRPVRRLLRVHTMPWTLADFVDLDRYPIDDLAGRGAALVARCRVDLAGQALCLLPGFITPDPLAAIHDEIVQVQERAYPVEIGRPAYSWLRSDEFPEGHPVRMRLRHKLGTITRDNFDPHGWLLGLFARTEVREFLRRAYGAKQFYPIVDPFLGVNVKIMRAGDEHAWHFDGNDGSTSLMIQPAREGGLYEYVPYIRSKEDENFDAVARVLQGDRTGVRHAEITPGTLTLFNGHRSLHRVSPVTKGDPDRMIALLSYDEKPNYIFPDSTLEAVLGRVPASAEVLRRAALQKV